MELISRKEKMEIIRDITLEDDIFFSKCLDLTGAMSAHPSCSA